MCICHEVRVTLQAFKIIAKFVLHSLQKISDDFVNFERKKYPKVKPSKIFKPPKYLRHRIKLLSSSEAV